MPDKLARPAPLHRLGVAIMVALAAALVGPAPALGHAALVASDPAAGASLTGAPGELSLTFSEELDPAGIELVLRAGAGSPVADLSEATLDASRTTASVALPELEPDVYTVHYRVVSAVDGHTTAGSYTFLVDPTGILPPPSSGTTATAPGADLPAVAARWVALAASLAAFGSALFWLLVARRHLERRYHAAGRASMPWGLVAILALGGAAALVAYLGLAARPLSTGPDAFPLDPAGPFGWTPFAVAMRTAVGALALAGGIGAWRSLRRPAPAAELPLGWATLLLLATALLGMSLAGHASALGGPLSAAFDWLHLLAVGAWLGPMPAFGVLARRARLAGQPVGATLRAALAEHARVAFAAVPIVALSGAANSPLVVDSGRDLVGSGYGNLVLAKALLFSVAVGIGAANHFLVRRVSGRLVPLLAVEAAVAAAAVLAAAGMLTIQPATGSVPRPPPAAIGAAHLFGTAGPSSVHLAVSIASPGEQRYQVALADADRQPIPADAEVALTFRPPDGTERDPELVVMERQADGVYGATGNHTPIVGEWRITVEVSGADGPAATEFALPVTEPMTPAAPAAPDTGLGVPAPLVAAGSALPPGPAAWTPTLFLLGAAASVAARSRRGSSGARPSRRARRAVAVAVTLAVAAGAVAGTRTLLDVANAVPSGAAAAVNPMPASTESLTRGARLYRANCSGCHGSAGAGDGPISGELAIGLRPLGELVPDRTDGELAHRIASGMVGLPMPGFAGVLSDRDRWDLVNHLRAEWDGDR